jgi:hypothetical protein
MPATPVIVPKQTTVARNPDGLAQLATAGNAGAGITLAGLRYGYGPTAATLKAKSAKPMFGVAGAEGGATQTADAGLATVFPSQFCFPTTKYHNAARLRGMS